MRILVLGASGMLGNAVLRLFGQSVGFECFGTVRGGAAAELLPTSVRPQLIEGIDAGKLDDLMRAMEQARPDVLVNCIGVVKQLAGASDPMEAIPLNALLPHRLARLCGVAGARFVHISTDCVFSGEKGMYRESDTPDASDLYGRSKYLGEVDYQNAVTLRTSIIGHELGGSRSLVDWFLSQEAEVEGYRRAIFSGLPTVEMARAIRDHVIPNPELHGVYHVSAEPIDKLSLLRLVADVYGKSITICPSDRVAIDRSLDSARFRNATGFSPKPWPDLVGAMEQFR